ncbi:hypothetical protein BH11BAC2_BH11BAC2_23420 [soil metagenome]
MNEFWKIIQVILISSVKFVAGPPFAYFNNRYEFTFLETVIYCVIGGMLGVFTFTYFSKPIFNGWHKLIHSIKNLFKKPEKFSPPVVDVDPGVEVHYEYIEKKSGPEKRVFSSNSRKIVKVWKTYGLMGIAFLTPVILSIPIGTVIANSFEGNRKKIFVYMFFSILLWSLAMTSAFEIYHANSVKELQDQINK